MIFALFQHLRWRPSRSRVRRRAAKLIRAHGELAFFRAHEHAWWAQGGGNPVQACFWQAVSREVTRQIQRDAILRGSLAPGPRSAPEACDVMPALEPGPSCKPADPGRCEEAGLPWTRSVSEETDCQNALGTAAQIVPFAGSEHRRRRPT